MLSRGFSCIWENDTFAVKSDINIDEISLSIRNGTGLLFPYNALHKSGYYLDHDSLLMTAVVGAPDSGHLNVMYHPFNLAIDAPIGYYASISSAQLSEFKDPFFIIEESVNKGNTKYIKVQETLKRTGMYTIYFIDSERGYLPFITESYIKKSDSLHSRMVIIDAKEYSGYWFPMHAMLTTKRIDGKYEVREMKVTHLDFDFVPTSDDFSVSIPRSTQFQHPKDIYATKSLYRSSDQEFVTITANQLEGIYKKLLDQAIYLREAEANERKSPTQPSVPASSSWHLMVYLNLLFVAVIAAIVIYKKIRPSKE